MTGNKDDEVNELGPKETYQNDKPQVQLYENTPYEENLESLEVDNSALTQKVNKNLFDIFKLYEIH